MTIKPIITGLRKTIFRRLSWIGIAVALVSLLIILHLLGWRDDTAIISGTSAGTTGQSNGMIVRGVLYGLVYFSAVIISPILILATGIYALMQRIKPIVKN